VAFISFVFLSFLNLASQTAFFSSVLVDIFPPVVFVYLLFKSLFFSFAFGGYKGFTPLIVWIPDRTIQE